MKQIKLGNKVRVSDPCYGTEVWCAGTIDNVKEGIYNVEVEYSDEGMWGRRVKSLSVFHSEENCFCFTDRADFEVGVDSGQAGIYDEDYYNEYHDSKDVNDDWYDDVCNLTLTKEQFGTFSKGVVSSSGFGDGGYNCYFATNKAGQVIAIQVVFIEEDDYEDDYE